MRVVQGDITKVSADVICNAANGIGFMGGFLGRVVRLAGVAESIHYVTKGTVEREAKQKCRQVWYLPRNLTGYEPGEIYVTGAGNLDAKWIIHAVTMRYPGQNSSYTVVERLLPKIVHKARLLGAKSVAIPLLGTGTGRLNWELVLSLYRRELASCGDLDILVVTSTR